MKTAKQIAEAANGGMPLEVVIDHFRVKQKQDYAFKKNYARVRAWEFYEHPEINGDAYVAVGGLDIITLFVFLRSIGIDVPGISVSSLEDKSIQKVHKALGYQEAPFKVSDRCCYYLKEKPCNDYAKESGRFPYMGLMASEGGQKAKGADDSRM